MLAGGSVERELPLTLCCLRRRCGRCLSAEAPLCWPSAPHVEAFHGSGWEHVHLTLEDSDAGFIHATCQPASL